MYRLQGAPVRLDYRLSCDRAWRTTDGSVHGWVGERAISAEIVRAPSGGWLLNGAQADGLDGCVDLDFGFTPATNFVQLRRIALAVGDAAEVPVAWLDVPDATLGRLEQRYRRVAADKYAYDSERFDYHAVLEMDEHGFARVYPGLWEQER